MAVELRVSAIIPVHNGERFVAEAIASAVGQRPPPWEVIVVDDGSTDGTAAIVQRFDPPVRYVAQRHTGVAAARNRGVAEAGGDIVAFLDADDRWPDGKLAVGLAALAADGGYDLVCGSVVQVPDSEWAAVIGAGKPPAPGPGACLLGTAMVRRSAFERVGPFDTRWRAGEFVDWYQRAVETGLRIRLIPEVALWRRLHDANHGVRERPVYAPDYLSIVRAGLQRRRAREGTEGGR